MENILRITQIDRTRHGQSANRHKAKLVYPLLRLIQEVCSCIVDEDLGESAIVVKMTICCINQYVCMFLDNVTLLDCDMDFAVRDELNRILTIWLELLVKFPGMQLLDFANGFPESYLGIDAFRFLISHLNLWKNWILEEVIHLWLLLLLEEIILLWLLLLHASELVCRFLWLHAKSVCWLQSLWLHAKCVCRLLLLRHLLRVLHAHSHTGHTYCILLRGKCTNGLLWLLSHCLHVLVRSHLLLVHSTAELISAHIGIAWCAQISLHLLLFLSPIFHASCRLRCVRYHWIIQSNIVLLKFRQGHVCNFIHQSLNDVIDGFLVRFRRISDVCCEHWHLGKNDFIKAFVKRVDLLEDLLVLLLVLIHVD